MHLFAFIYLQRISLLLKKRRSSEAHFIIVHTELGKAQVEQTKFVTIVCEFYNTEWSCP